ncbi:aminoglycoside 6'-N-acetyltransferase [Massilia sp. BSC265]|uniref:aminoglycoside 6'-N-acetyltransferase n=1 Tax=Massilia sp. BSC265 TaxID=1549812 RepID=UPI0004E88C52|nr:aminoglycoside 6'-N-acetyltransferase [Massilia sp. BSC265]KFI05240.1 aminoglycoside 6'-acetyltransferase [Massilia sp. BSC265]
MSSIKPCTSVEQAGWLQLRMALWLDDRDKHLQEMQELCAQPGRYAQFIACSRLGEPQGLVEVALRSDYVNGTASSPVGFLEGLYVDPAFRKQGIAAMLVQTAEEWVRRQGCTEMASDALLENTASHAMHRALGFAETERVVYFRKLLS